MILLHPQGKAEYDFWKEFGAASTAQLERDFEAKNNMRCMDRDPEKDMGLQEEDKLLCIHW